MSKLYSNKRDEQTQLHLKKKYKLPKWVWTWDDEREIGNPIMIGLHYGYSFEPDEHEGIRSFDTVSEARTGVQKKNVYPCDCNICKRLKTNPEGI